MAAINPIQPVSRVGGVRQGRVRGANFAQAALSGADRLPGQPAGSVEEARQNITSGRLSQLQGQQFNRAFIRQQTNIANAQVVFSSANAGIRQGSTQAAGRRTQRSPINERITARREQTGRISANTRQAGRTARSFPARTVRQTQNALAATAGGGRPSRTRIANPGQRKFGNPRIAGMKSAPGNRFRRLTENIPQPTTTPNRINFLA